MLDRFHTCPFWISESQMKNARVQTSMKIISNKDAMSIVQSFDHKNYSSVHVKSDLSIMFSEKCYSHLQHNDVGIHFCEYSSLVHCCNCVLSRHCCKFCRKKMGDYIHSAIIQEKNTVVQIIRKCLPVFRSCNGRDCTCHFVYWDGTRNKYTRRVKDSTKESVLMLKDCKTGRMYRFDHSTGTPNKYQHSVKIITRNEASNRSVCKTTSSYHGVTTQQMCRHNKVTKEHAHSFLKIYQIGRVCSNVIHCIETHKRLSEHNAKDSTRLLISHLKVWKSDGVCSSVVCVQTKKQFQHMVKITVNNPVPYFKICKLSRKCSSLRCVGTQDKSLHIVEDPTQNEAMSIMVRNIRNKFNSILCFQRQNQHQSNESDITTSNAVPNLEHCQIIHEAVPCIETQKDHQHTMKDSTKKTAPNLGVRQVSHEYTFATINNSRVTYKCDKNIDSNKTARLQKRNSSSSREASGYECTTSSLPICFSRQRTRIVLVVLITYLLVALDRTESKIINIGLLVPKTGRKPMGDEVTKAAQYMITRINNDPSLVKTRQLNISYSYIWEDTECAMGVGLSKMADMFYSKFKKVDVFVGPGCQTLCESTALLGAKWKIPLISYGCFLESLWDLTLYPTLFKSLGTCHDLAHFIVSMVEFYKWTYVTTVITSDISRWKSIQEAIWNLMELPSDHKRRWLVDFGDAKFNHTATEYLIESEVFILLMYPKEADMLLQKIEELHFFKKNYVFITVDFKNFAKRFKTVTEPNNAYTGLLDITTDIPFSEPTYHHFLRTISSTLNSSQCNFSYEYGIDAALVADAFQLIALGVEKALQRGSRDVQMVFVLDYFNQVTFKGISGDIKVHSDLSNRRGYLLNNLVKGCYYAVARGFIHGDNSVNYTRIMTPIVWPGYTIHIPVGGRPCFENRCVTDDSGNTGSGTVALVISLLVSLPSFILALILLFRITRRRNKRNINDSDWIISRAKLYAAPALMGKVGELTGGRDFDKLHESRSSVLGAGPTFSVRSRKMSRDSLKHISVGHLYTKIAMIDNQLVAIKPLRKHSVILTKEIKTEINRIRKLSHPNVNQFVGACVEAGSVCLVWAYCPKGSLCNILQNEKVKLDWIFKMSFISDIARGMAYLHDSPVKVHGRLKSSNVIVDSNWTCKLTDMAMPGFRAGEKDDRDENQQYFGLLWTAPELLRDPMLSVTGTVKGDVYAYAIMIQEIITRQNPFGEESHDPNALVRRVKRGEHPPCRPFVSRATANDEVIDLMIICWDEIPYFRPSFSIICDSLKKIRMSLGTATNLVDQMIHMLSKYADHLEELVEERTAQLQEEQKRTENLLSKMLPASVAQSLKDGHPVKPESFSSVTVFFSDIVGFATLAATSTPLEVVNFLNDLYTLFDKVIEKYDVYKVETIGDGYVVASGLPVRNENRHAGEIATMALNLLSSVQHFTIRHRPRDQVGLRIGIHSGPVVAGVVGLKMPRYCLFGDTVNYASRMESSGEALKIHVSPECKANLDYLGGFVLEERGLVMLKGKGQILTYYLIGKEGFNMSLPKHKSR